MPLASSSLPAAGPWLNMPNPRAPPARNRARVARRRAACASGDSSSSSTGAVGAAGCGEGVARCSSVANLGVSSWGGGDAGVSPIGRSEVKDFFGTGGGMPNLTPPSLAMRAAISDRRVFSSSSPVASSSRLVAVGDGGFWLDGERMWVGDRVTLGDADVSCVIEGLLTRGVGARCTRRSGLDGR